MQAMHVDFSQHHVNYSFKLWPVTMFMLLPVVFTGSRALIAYHSFPLYIGPLENKNSPFGFWACFFFSRWTVTWHVIFRSEKGFVPQASQDLLRTVAGPSPDLGWLSPVTWNLEAVAAAWKIKAAGKALKNDAALLRRVERSLDDNYVAGVTQFYLKCCPTSLLLSDYW